MNKKKAQHGGRRKGQTGRPPIPEAEKQICKTIRLKAWEWDALETIGNGSSKDAIRAMLEERMCKRILEKIKRPNQEKL